MKDFEIVSRDGGGDVVLSVVGEVDIATAWKLERALDAAIERPHSHVVVDLHDVDFMDASGAALLLRQDLHARAFGVPLLIVRGPPSVERLFDVLGLGGRLAIVDQIPVWACA